MRKVELRMKEQKKYDVIKELVDHNGNKERAALKLGITVRQVNRLIIIPKLPLCCADPYMHLPLDG